MNHLVINAVQALLHWLGVNDKQEFIVFALIYAGAFFIYAGRQFSRNKVYSVLYLALGMSILLFFFSEHVRGRWIGACGFVVTTIGLFGWYFARRPASTG
jgi:hypothetical protein